MHIGEPTRSGRAERSAARAATFAGTKASARAAADTGAIAIPRDQ